MIARRISVVFASAATALVLSTVPANAHFCFKRSLNAHAAQGMAGSANWVSFGDLAFEFTGLCPAGIAILAEGGGVEVDTLINGHGVMAGPTDGNKAIGHLDFEGLDAATPAAIAACS